MLSLKHIHTDSRGSIYTITGEELPYDEITMFTTKAKHARGGCIHNSSGEHITVISGEIVFVSKQDRATIEKRLYAGQSCSIPSKTPHYFEAITDSIVIEWGPKVAEKNERDEEFRAIVDGINKKAVK